MAGEREGFSLVELIIVIAIMAILIGVIALAVLPNINRSRESKDISQLDSIASAANAAIAVVQATGEGCAKIGDTTNGVDAGSDASEFDKIVKQISETVAAGAGKCGSSAASGKDIYLAYDTSDKTIQVAIVDSAPAGASKTAFVALDGSATQCGYLDQKFIVGGNS